ncbi:hypothetical protein Ade02nite_89190 [Paractinoplanes deccanensis]|uniref:Uncharacterized protein n=1 Tax=Paractinoplanes deccanensis TaxID=113561 RepID=A0ABQ3YJW2_9ACTN|nr:hypothetical protein [Actinoplanes deccanensis]GID80278.1 hypothetical protein Ade02nite_89190 [Actinoplanes deccanensis]
MAGDHIAPGPRELSAGRAASSRPAAFSIAGKGSFADNDQFQGVLDEVWVEIG